MEFGKVNVKKLMKYLPAELTAGLDGADYVVPMATQRELATLGRALNARAPRKLSQVEKQALEGVLMGCEYLDLVLEHNSQLKVVLVRDDRLKVVKDMAAMRSSLRAMAGADAGEIAEEAQAVLDEVLGGDLLRLHEVGPRTVWHVVVELQRRLAREKAWRARLDALVPAAVTARAFVNNDVLGRKLGLTSPETAPVRRDMRTAKALMRRRVSRYAAAVLGTADDIDPASLERAELALRPIVELRDEVARRHARKAVGKAEVEPAVEEEEEVEEVPDGEEEDEVEDTSAEAEVDETAPPGAGDG